MPHRYFTAEVGNGRAALNGTDAHHLADVMRAKIGENVILCDAHAVEYVGTITSIQPGRVEFTVTEGYPSAAEPSVEVTLFAGYPKLGKLEDTIRHSVELGVTNVVPFFSRYCVAAPKKEEQKNLRYNRIAFEAAKQSGRGVVPQVELPVTYKQMLADAARNDAAFFCYEAGGEPLLSRLGGAETIGLITGSEGGFSPEEAAAAREAGCVQIGLGPRILRCETAPLAALAAVMTLTGNLQ